jgi:hypothetical protein
MKVLPLRSVRARVLVACCLLVATAVSSGLWSAGTFWHLAGAIGQIVGMLRDGPGCEAERNDTDRQIS